MFSNIACTKTQFLIMPFVKRIFYGKHLSTRIMLEVQSSLVIKLQGCNDRLVLPKPIKDIHSKYYITHFPRIDEIIRKQNTPLV